MSTNGIAISTKGLVKHFSEDVMAVDKIDLLIPTNLIWGLSSKRAGSYSKP